MTTLINFGIIHGDCFLETLDNYHQLYFEIIRHTKELITLSDMGK